MKALTWHGKGDLIFNQFRAGGAAPDISVQRLRDDEAADNRDAERLAEIGPGAFRSFRYLPPGCEASLLPPF
jgi:hypothetical protein